MDSLERLLDAAIELGEKNADQAIQYGCQIMAMRRRIRSALVVLEQGRPEVAKRLLDEALADDGEFAKRRIDKVLKQWRAEHGFPP